MELNKQFEDLNWDDQTIDGNELKDIQQDVPNTDVYGELHLNYQIGGKWRVDRLEFVPTYCDYC